ncbi:hypothetical protein J7E91_21650 [Streptomyces sp. ISL-99]|uniref:hypothetical protein n=1 Tax=Streptomyces sp. ISL-99 TaxID=2819193 RepID=UPI001BE96C6E|nr:hypothetical protein [Streptomyces sp. ISL-99]MBT2527953.1 hypothetical protein [Streptomyces sp. ISL-99]
MAISILAFGISIFSLVDRKRLDKRDLTLKLHETLISPELQAGRHILFNLDREVTELSREEYGSANRALATLDVAGFYCAKGYINEGDFLDLWSPSLAKLKHKAAPFLAHRDAERPADLPAWPYLENLLTKPRGILTPANVRYPLGI